MKFILLQRNFKKIVIVKILPHSNVKHDIIILFFYRDLSIIQTYIEDIHLSNINLN